MTGFLWRRLRNMLRRDAYPYERHVCLYIQGFQEVLMAGSVAVWTAYAVFSWTPSFEPGPSGWLCRAWDTLASAAFGPAPPDFYGGLRPVDLLSWGGWWWYLGVAWLGVTIAGAAMLPSLWFADAGPEERLREVALGASVVPDIFPVNTWEACAAFHNDGFPPEVEKYLADVFDRNKFLSDPKRPDRGDPGSGWYDVFSEEEQTWAVKLHFRFVRPVLLRRGWRAR